VLKDKVPDINDRLSQWGGRMVSSNSPDGATAQVEMVHPTNPNKICFEMNIPKLLGKKTSVTSFEIKKAKASFCLRHAYRLLSNQSRVTLPDITSP
jgi:hypothetical protein